MSIIRVRPEVASIVYDDSTGMHVSLVGGAEYDTADHLVKAFPWAFQTDAEANNDTTRKTARRNTSVPVEEATAVPGSKRNR